MFPASAKHQIVDINNQSFPEAKNSLVCTDLPVSSNSIFLNGKHVFPNSLINS